MSETEQSTSRPPVVTPARVIAALCVVVPFVAVLWVPLYDKDKPEVAGFPFFFWWQLLWVAITAALMGLAYYVVRREEVSRRTSAVAVAGNVSDADDVTGTADRTGATAEAETAEEVGQAEPAGEAEATDDTTEEGDAK